MLEKQKHAKVTHGNISDKKVGDLMIFKKCKDCTDRRFNCHSYCESYLSYREKMLKVYEKRKMNVAVDIGTTAYCKYKDRRCERR